MKTRPVRRFVQSQRLLTVDETRERLGGICRNTLRSLETAQELVPRRIDRRVLYRESDVDLFITADSRHEPNPGLESCLRLLSGASGRVYRISFDSQVAQDREAATREIHSRRPASCEPGADSTSQANATESGHCCVIETGNQGGSRHQTRREST